MKASSKKEILSILKTILPKNPVIIEAGAFNGSDTKLLHNTWPQATIHAFEPVPEIYEQLVKNTKNIPQIHTYPLALDKQTGTATFYVSQHPKKPEKPFQAGSLLKPKERLTYSPIIYPTTITIPTMTIDDWAEKYGIDHVDFLWLDMQGNELPVLQASPEILKTVKTIYTEVEFIEAYEGQAQYEQVKEWLENQGFKLIARDFEDKPAWFFGNILLISLNGKR